jgi:hypothetical protein
VLSRRVVATRNPPPPRSPFETREGSNVRTEVANQHPEPSGIKASGEQPRPEQPSMNPRPEESRPVPRPQESARPAEPQSRNEAPRPEEHAVPRPPAQNQRSWDTPHPLVREAPAVQPKPEHQQQEQTKFRNWEQQRPQSPAPHPATPAKNPQPKNEKR